MGMMNDLLALSHVPRWSVVRTVCAQSVADHSYRVAIIALELYGRLYGFEPVRSSVIMSEILLYALIHDVVESHTGDIPGHVKSGSSVLGNALDRIGEIYCPWMEQFTPQQSIIKLVKIADLIEATSFIWMNRVGPHAEWVWKYTRDKLTEEVNKTVNEVEKDKLGQVVRDILSDIEGEGDRLILHSI